MGNQASTQSKTIEEYIKTVREEVPLKKTHSGKHIHKSNSYEEYPRIHTAEYDPNTLSHLDDVSVEIRMSVLETLLCAPPGLIPDEPFTFEFLHFLFVEHGGSCEAFKSNEYTPFKSQYAEWRNHPDVRDLAIVHDVLLANDEDIELTWIELRSRALQDLASSRIEDLKAEEKKAMETNVALPVEEVAKGKGKRKKEQDEAGPAKKIAIKDGKIVVPKSSNAAEEEVPAMTEEQVEAAAEMRENRAGFVASKKKEAKDKDAAVKRMKLGRACKK